MSSTKSPKLIVSANIITIKQKKFTGLSRASTLGLSRCEHSGEALKVVGYFGGPGTGKTYLLKQMKQKFGEEAIVLSPTWTNAEIVGGQTIFSHCGCSFVRPKPKPFAQRIILIDEVFMFDKKTMQLILDCIEKDSEMYLFGDPFQIKHPEKNDDSDNYFYNAFYDTVPLRNLIKVEYLTKYYRCQFDPQLQAIIQNYRVQKKLVKSELLKTIGSTTLGNIKFNDLVIVNTHRKEEEIRRKIKYKNREPLLGQDGKVYWKEQRVFILNRNGCIQKQGFLQNIFKDGAVIKIEDKRSSNTEDVLFQPRISNGKIKYDFVSGDVVVVNLIQGLEFDCNICVCIDDFFEFGALYTALSRAKRLSQIKLLVSNNKEKIFETDLNNEFIV